MQHYVSIQDIPQQQSQIKGESFAPPIGDKHPQKAHQDRLIEDNPLG